jgi:hypothetical protein
MGWSRRPSAWGLALAAAVCLAGWPGPAASGDVEPAREAGRAVPLREAVATVARGLGLSVEGGEHLAGLVQGPIGPSGRRTLGRLLSGYSFAIVLDDARSGRLLILGGAGAAPAALPDGPASPATASGRPLWGFADVASLAGKIPDDEIRVLAEASQAADLDARLTAVSGLAQHGTAGVEILAAATRDADPAVRLTAVQHLAGAGAAAARHLARAFDEVPDPQARALALSALAASDPVAARHLAATALHDPDPTVRAAAEQVAGPGSGPSAR